MGDLGTINSLVESLGEFVDGRDLFLSRESFLRAVRDRLTCELAKPVAPTTNGPPHWWEGRGPGSVKCNYP